MLEISKQCFLKHLKLHKNHFKTNLFLGRAVARAPISGFVILWACLPVTVSFWRGFENSH